MNETLNLSGLKGHIKVELFDNEGNKKFEDEGSNGITTFGANLISLKQKVALGFGSPVLPTFYEQTYGEFAFNPGSYSAPLKDVVKTLCLTDDDTVFSASEDKVTGNVTGLSARDIYNNVSNQLAGTLNVAESYCSLSEIKMVFDFPTDKANGTHKSVSLLCEKDPTANCFLKRSVSLTERIVFPHPDISENSYTQVVTDGTNIWVLTRLKIYKYDMNGTYVSEIDINFDGNSNSVMYTGQDGFSQYYNGYAYLASSSSGTIVKVNLTTGLVSNIAKPTGYPVSCYGVIFNGYLYYTNGSSTLYRMNLATEIYDTYKTVPGADFISSIILVKNNKLILSARVSLVYGSYEYDWDTNTVGTDILGQRYNSTASGWELRDTSRKSSTIVDETNDVIYFTKVDGAPYIENNGVDTTGYGIVMAKLDITNKGSQVVARRVLGTPVTKTDQDTMKVSYTLSFV